MGTLSISDPRDKKVFSEASLIIGKLITGKNNKQELELLKKLFLKHIESVTFTPYNSRPLDDLGNTSTIGPIKISSVGHYGISNTKQEADIRHAITHELLHAHVAAIQKENPISYHKNGNNYTGIAGYICNSDDLSHNGNKRVYGLFLMEALTEILTDVAMASFDEQYKLEHPNVNANTILKTSYNGLSSENNAYIPMAKLMIQVFSNCGNIDYSKIIEHSDNKGLCSFKIKTDTNKIIRSNDLLYGYMYNPIHTLEMYNEILGDSAYINLLSKFDRIKNNNHINKAIVEELLHDLSVFSIKKSSYLVKKGILTNKEATQLLTNIQKQMQIAKEQYNIDISQGR